MSKILFSIIMIMGLSVTVLLSQDIPNHTVLIYYNPLDDENWPGPGVMENKRGNFLPGQGWQTLDNHGQLMITLPEDLPFEGSFEIEVTNFDPPNQSWDDKHQMINLYSRPEGSKAIYDTDAAWWNFRTGDNYLGSGPNKGGFKFLSQSRHVDSRTETRYLHEQKWNTNDVHVFKFIWTRQNIWICMDGEKLKRGKHPFEGQIEPFRYAFLGTDNVYNTMPGPIYSNLKIYTNEEEGTSPGVVKVSGDGQEGNPGVQLAEPLSVQALNSKGEAFKDVPVIFEITKGGGYIVEEQPILTDAQGLASAHWVLGTGAVNNEVLAFGDGLPGDSAIFTATALAASRLQEVQGDGQTGRVAEPVPDSVTVKVLSQAGDGVEQWLVEFEITDGGGSLNGAGIGPIEVLTNDLGIAKVQWILGNVVGINNNMLQARANLLGQPLQGSPITFTASAQPGSDTLIVKVSGDLQTGVVGTELSEPITIWTTDQFSNPHANVAVDFDVRMGGGDIMPTESVTRLYTNADGFAAVNWILGPVAGAASQSLVASLVYGRRDSVIFTANALAGPINQNNSSLEATTPITADGLAQSTITLSLKDDYGNAIADNFTTFFATGSNNVLTQPSGPTNTAGQAIGYLASTTAEIKTVWAEVNGKAVTYDSFYVRFIPGSASQLIKTSGDGQEGSVNKPLTEDIVVGVFDAYDNPVINYVVEFVVTGGGGSVNSNQVLSDVQGLASVEWTLGMNPGMNTLEARAPGLSGSPIVFNATGIINEPHSIELVSGNSQVGVVNQLLANNAVVGVYDVHGNPFENYIVNFVITSGGGSVTNNQVATNTQGLASVGWTLGTTTGLNTLEARTPDLNGSPVNFTATGVPDQPHSIKLISGDDQVGIVNQPLANDVVAGVFDAFNNSIQNFIVDFVITAGGGSLSSSQVLTNAQGLASVSWTLGVSPGLNRVEARAQGLSGSPVIYSATGITDQPHSIERVSGENQVGVPKSVLSVPLSVRVKNSQNQDLLGIPVHFRVKTGAFQITTPSPVLTDQAGLAMAQVRLDTVAGANVAAVWAEGLAETVLFHFTTLPGDERHLRIIAGNNQLGRPSQELPEPLVSAITDQYKNPIYDFSVTYDVSIGGGVIKEAQPVMTDGDGTVQCRWILGAEVEQKVLVTAQAIGSPMVFSATVVNSAPVITVPSDTSISVGQALLFLVRVTDPDDDAVIVGASGLPVGVIFDSLDTRAFAWIPTREQAGQHHIQFSGTDVYGATTTASVTITVEQGQNLSPLILAFTPTTSSLSVNTGEILEFNVVAYDPENDPLSYNWLVNDIQVGDESEFALYVFDTLPSPFEVKVAVSDGINVVSRVWVIEHMPTRVELASFGAMEISSAHVYLQWVTTSETGNWGFNVYRAEGNTDLFEMLNQQILPANGNGTYSYNDETVTAGKTYYYQLEDINQAGYNTKHDPVKIVVPVPSKFSLFQNYPNPFNPETKIKFDMPRSSFVRLSIYNIAGQEIRVLVDVRLAAGSHQVVWDGRDNNGVILPSGVYYYHLEAEDFVQTKKLLFLR